jgi:hypothetical protein
VKSKKNIIAIIKRIPYKTGWLLNTLCLISITIVFFIEIGYGIPVDWCEKTIEGVNDFFKWLLFTIPAGFIFYIPTVAIPEIKEDIKLQPIVKKQFQIIKWIYEDILNNFDYSGQIGVRVSKLKAPPKLDEDDSVINTVLSSVADWNSTISYHCPAVGIHKYSPTTSYCQYILNQYQPLKQAVSRLDTYRKQLTTRQIEILEQLLNSRFFIEVIRYPLSKNVAGGGPYSTGYIINYFIEDKEKILELFTECSNGN